MWTNLFIFQASNSKLKYFQEYQKNVDPIFFLAEPVFFLVDDLECYFLCYVEIQIILEFKGSF